MTGTEQIWRKVWAEGRGGSGPTAAAGCRGEAMPLEAEWPDAEVSKMPDAALGASGSFAVATGAAREAMGGLVQVDRPRFTEDGSALFFRAVKRRTFEHLRNRGHTRFGGRRMLAKGLVLGLSALVFYLVALLGGFPAAPTLLFAVLFGVAALLLALNVGHDAAHGTLAPDRRFNDLMQLLTFSLVGADSYLWKIRHVRSHHISPNVRGFDVDVGENGMVRLSPAQEYRWYYRYQHLYAPLVFGIVNLHTVLFYDFRCLVKRRVENVALARLTADMLFRFVLLKAVFMLVMFVVPYAAMGRPWWHIVLGAFVVTFVNSIIFLTLLIGTHHCEGIEYPETGRNGVVPHGWAYHQVVTALDWMPGSRIVNFLAGGANTHVAHHLFPNVSHVHYVEISKIIQEEALRFRIPYRNTSFTGMIRSHYRHLKALGAAGAV